MRKMLWGGIALTVCIGVGVVLVARQSSRSPDSFLARVVGLAYSTVGGGAVVPDTHVLPPMQVTNPVYVPPQDRVEEQTGTEAIEPLVVAGEQPERTSTPDLNLPIRNSEYDYSTPRFGGYQGDDSETSEPPVVLEPEQTPDRMPYVDDSAAVSECVTELMTRYRELHKVGKLKEALAVLRQVTELDPDNLAAQAAMQMLKIETTQMEYTPEQPQAEFGVEFGSGVGAGVRSAIGVAVEETPCASGDEDSCCLMQGLYGWVKRLTYLMGFRPAPQDSTIEQPAVECPDPIQVDEPTETPSPYSLPTMREDPNYHHHYPSCPYTGQCPYPNRYQVPSALPAQPVETTPKPPKPERKLRQHSSYFVPVPEGPEGHSDVDTMECRPTDVPHQWRATRPF